MAGKVPPSELKQFEEYFVKASQRQNAVAFALALRKHKSELRRPRTLYKFLKAAAAIVIVGFGLGLWQAFKDRSGVAKGLLALHSAYQNQRPVEARITDFTYALQQRGSEEKVDYVQRDLARSLLLSEVAEHPSVESHRALGQYYLASRQFDQAVRQFREALKLDAEDARANADLGAALFELGKLHSPETDRQDLAAREFAESLQHLNKALERDPSLTEPLFNRALLYQYMKLPSQAEQDWRAYLARDPNSPWAVEAQQNLKAVEEQRKQISQSNEEVLKQFRIAQQTSDDSTSSKLVSSYHNRTGNVVFEQALDSYIEAVGADEKEHARSDLQLLSYVGDLARRQAKDNFFSDLAGYYAAASKERLATLREARALMKSAHEGWGRSPADESLTQFSQAQKLFEKAADACEAIFAGYWVSFCLYRDHRTEQGWTRLQTLIPIAEAKGYRWLTVRMLYLSAGLQYDFTNYSRAVELAERSLALAEETDDVVGELNGLSSLIEYYRNFSHFDKSFSYIQRSLPLLGITTLDPVQGCRHYGLVAKGLAAAGWYDAAAAYQTEALQYAYNTARPVTVSNNLEILSEIEAKRKKFDEALNAASRAFEIAEANASDPASRDPMAYASLQMGHVYRQAGNCDKAIDSYDRAINLYKELDYSTQIYQGHKGRLFCYIAQGNDSLAQQEIDQSLALMESYRDTIFEAANREAFFNAEQSVYDVAMRFESSKVNSPERAFEYSESSRARTLLDLIHSEPRVLTKDPDHNLILDHATHSLSWPEIKLRLPDQVQLVQFAELDDQILIWVVADKKISSIAVAVTREEIENRVRTYLTKLSSASAASSDEVSRSAKELYKTLIAPIETHLDRKKQLCFVPDKILNFLPFGTLISPASGRYLLEDYVLTVAPSATMLILSSENARLRGATKQDKILSVGNPDFDRQAYAAFPNLPSAAREATDLAALYPSGRVLVDRDATVGEVLSQMPSADVIHFALHSILDERFPIRSKFLMARSPASDSGESALFAYNIYDLDLKRTKLAVLSACETGSGRYFGGEGVINMARPFLAAGVPLVVASLWRVETNSTGELMVNFHRYRVQKGLTTAQALQKAQLDMVRGSNIYFRQPYYWAPFVVIGGFAEF